MDRNELTATNWFASRFVALVLALTGVYFFMGRDAPGFEWFAGHFGESRFQGFGLLLAFLVLASQSWDQAKVRLRMAELLETMNQLLYGKDYRRDREAIEILLSALESQNAENAKIAYDHLVRLTGQKFAQDPHVWRAWWTANKKRFERARDAAAAPK